MSTQTTEMDMLYDFETEAQDAVPPPPPPDPGVPKEPEPKPVEPTSIEAVLSKQFNIVIQLYPHDGDPAGRQCLIGVRVDGQPPEFAHMRGLGPLPDIIVQLMIAQAQRADTKPATKKVEIPPPLTVTKAKPTPVQKVAPAQAPTPAPAPVAAAAAQDDIYSLFDL